jgi:hypothetical protein
MNSIRRMARVGLAMIALLVVSITVVAHHSGAEFDNTKVVELNGTIKEFQFKNPHTWIQVLVPDSKGGNVEWSLEWGSPNNLGRDGYRPSTFPPGAKVAVRFNPMRSGAPAGMFLGAKFQDGKTIGRWE